MTFLQQFQASIPFQAIFHDILIEYAKLYQCAQLGSNNKINDPILNLTPENIPQHSGIE